MYIFSSDRQYIFNISVDGQLYMVKFGDKNAFGASVFTTTSAKIAEAIRATSMVRKGQIAELTPEEERSDWQEKSVAPGDTATSDAEKAEVRRFANISQAKEWLSRTYGVAKGNIRSMAAVEAFAKDKGIRLEFSES